MRSFCLFLSFLCVLTLTACGSEEELNPPVFSEIAINGSTDLSSPATQTPITITGRIDDAAANIVAFSLATDKVTVPVVVVDNSDGSKSNTWEFVFTPLSVDNTVTLTATDASGNINQLILTVIYSPAG